MNRARYNKIHVRDPTQVWSWWSTSLYPLGLTESQEDKARELHEKAIVIDCSVVIRYEPAYFERAKKGGITAHNHTVSAPHSGLVESLREVTECLQWLNRNKDKCALALAASNIEKAKKEGRVAVILGPQNIPYFERDLTFLMTFHRLGVRIIQLTYQHRNQVGNGCGERVDEGLSNFGIEVVQEMNCLGIVVDLSHCGPKTSADAIEHSSEPVIFSHSHPYAISAHVRNKTDELITAMAEKGGIIGITAYSPICETRRNVRPTLNEYLDHIEYVCRLVGVNHVGIGLDIDETSTPEHWDAFKRSYPEICGNYTSDTRRVDGLSNIAMIPNITRGLVLRGYSDGEIRRILGGNFLRVFRRVWGIS